MDHRTTRPAHCEPWSITDVRELGDRLRLSRERLETSELVHNGPAWRLWAACVEATFGYGRAADQIYVGTLARLARMKRQKASPLLDRFNELGVFVWDKAPRGSHGISELGLPPLSTCAPMGTMTDGTCAPVGTMSAPAGGLHVPPGGPLHSYVVESHVVQSTELITSKASELGSSETGAPERDAPVSRPPEPEPETVDPVELAAALEESLAGYEPEPDPYADLSAKTRRHFGLDNPDAFHGDERTGDGIGDDEASQMRWRGANPRKARARRNR
jgi:hypothetical protein